MDTQETPRICRNCGSQVDDRYCPRCGQEYDSTRITWRSLYDEAVSLFIGDSIFSEKGTIVRYGMLQTLWSVIRHPAATVGEYIAGKQCKYVPPLTLLLLVCTACLLILNWFGIKLLDLTPGNEEDELTPLLQGVGEFLSAHLEVIALLKLPCLALAYKWIFRKCSPLRYMEYFYIGLYLASLHIILLSGTAVLAHVCDIPADGMVQRLLANASAATLFVYNVIIVRNLLRISWVRATAGYFLCMLITYVSVIALCIAAATCLALCEGSI